MSELNSCRQSGTASSASSVSGRLQAGGGEKGSSAGAGGTGTVPKVRQQQQQALSVSGRHHIHYAG